MAKTVVLVCDKCSGTDGVATFSAGKSGATPYEVDLCRRCAGPLEEIVELGRERAADLAPAGTTVSREPELRTKVYMPEELDRMEEEYRKAHKKK